MPKSSKICKKSPEETIVSFANIYMLRTAARDPITSHGIIRKAYVSAECPKERIRAFFSLVLQATFPKVTERGRKIDFARTLRRGDPKVYTLPGCRVELGIFKKLASTNGTNFSGGIRPWRAELLSSGGLLKFCYYYWQINFTCWNVNSFKTAWIFNHYY